MLSHALFIMENANLQELWDVKSLGNESRLQILKGNMFFQRNPKLCYNKIMSFVEWANQTHQVSERTISRLNNGDEAACEYSLYYYTTCVITSI